MMFSMLINLLLFRFLGSAPETGAGISSEQKPTHGVTMIFGNTIPNRIVRMPRCSSNSIIVETRPDAR